MNVKRTFTVVQGEIQEVCVIESDDGKSLVVNGVHGYVMQEGLAAISYPEGMTLPCNCYVTPEEAAGGAKTRLNEELDAIATKIEALRKQVNQFAPGTRTPTSG